jgi:hypothetical protein
VNPGATKSTKRRYVKTGFHGTKRALARSGLTVIDGRSPVGRQIARARTALEDHLGGAGAVSVTQSRVIEAVLTLDVLIDTACGALQKLGPVDRRAGALRPLARELAGLIGQRHALLRDLGFKRAPREVPSLAAYLEARSARLATEAAQAEAAKAEPSPAPAEPEPAPNAPDAPGSDAIEPTPEEPAIVLSTPEERLLAGWRPRETKLPIEGEAEGSDEP